MNFQNINKIQEQNIEQMISKWLDYVLLTAR